jgi:hypothetical protein
LLSVSIIGVVDLKCTIKPVFNVFCVLLHALHPVARGFWRRFFVGLEACHCPIHGGCSGFLIRSLARVGIENRWVKRVFRIKCVLYF